MSKSIELQEFDFHIIPRIARTWQTLQLKENLFFDLFALWFLLRSGYTFTEDALRKILMNPDLNKMAEQVEPTIGTLINEKHLKQLMEDVRGSDDANW